MGVLTTMYSVPPQMMKKINADNERLAFVTGDAEDEDGGNWKCDSIDFDKHYVEVIGLLNTAGHNKVYKILDVESSEGDLELDPYDLLLVKPAKVKKLAELLKGVTPASIKKELEGKEVTDYYGKPMLDSDIDSYLSELPRIQKLLKKAVADGHSLIVAEA